MAIVAVALGGCGGRASGNADGAAADLGADRADAAVDAGADRATPDAGFAGTLEAFCDEEAHAWCAYLARCNRAFAEQEDCRTVEKARCFAPVGDWQEAAAGQSRVALADSSVAACLDGIAQLPCGVTPERPAACAAVSVGTVADGQPCVRAGECRGGICDLPDDACPGTCRAPGPQGGLCVTAADCEQPHSSCLPAPNVQLCLTEAGGPACRCAARGGPGASCAHEQQCLPGLRCDSGACRAPAAAKGDACGFQAGCAGDLACLGPTGADGGTPLGACGDRLADGAVCVGDQCRAGLHCQPGIGGGGSCRPDARVGDACTKSQTSCPLGAFCDDANVCRPRPKSGESCAGAAHDACWGPNLVCASIAGLPPTCTPIPNVSQPCDRVCAQGAFCLNGICWPKLAPGERCGANDDCASARCKLPAPTRCQGASCGIKVCMVSCAA